MGGNEEKIYIYTRVNKSQPDPDSTQRKIVKKKRKEKGELENSLVLYRQGNVVSCNRWWWAVHVVVNCDCNFVVMNEWFYIPLVIDMVDIQRQITTITSQSRPHYTFFSHQVTIHHTSETTVLLDRECTVQWWSIVVLWNMVKLKGDELNHLPQLYTILWISL